jgi:predicted glutamine amidotransferase
MRGQTMCKLLMMTGITESLTALEFMKRMAVPMSKRNTDGIGYTAVKSDGSMFAERWHNNYSFMDYKSIMVPKVAEQLVAFADRLPIGALDTNYNRRGVINYKDLKTVTMHTRFATCGTEFENVHPFIDKDTSLVHNGSIRNAFSGTHSVGLDLNKVSSCDSEAALQTYIDQGVSGDTSKAKKWLDILTGSWAFGVLSRNSDGLRILDVVRGSSWLYSMQVEGLGTVFATDKDDVVGVCKDMNLTFIKEPSLMDMDSMFRFNAISGELLESPVIKTPYVHVPVVNNWKYNAGSNARYPSYQHGGSGSSYSNPSSNKSTQGTYPSDQDGIDDSEAPQLRTKKGKWDTNLVAKYLDDAGEPFIDRLDIFDLVYGRALVNMYESLPDDMKIYVEETDFTADFKEARKLIVQLDDARRAQVV